MRTTVLSLIFFWFFIFSGFCQEGREIDNLKNGLRIVEINTEYGVDRVPVVKNDMGK